MLPLVIFLYIKAVIQTGIYWFTGGMGSAWLDLYYSLVAIYKLATAHGWPYCWLDHNLARRWEMGFGCGSVIPWHGVCPTTSIMNEFQI